MGSHDQCVHVCSWVVMPTQNVWGAEYICTWEQHHLAPTQTAVHPAGGVHRVSMSGQVFVKCVRRGWVTTRDACTMPVWWLAGCTSFSPAGAPAGCLCMGSHPFTNDTGVTCQVWHDLALSTQTDAHARSV